MILLRKARQHQIGGAMTMKLQEGSRIRVVCAKCKKEEFLVQVLPGRQSYDCQEWRSYSTKIEFTRDGNGDFRMDVWAA